MTIGILVEDQFDERELLYPLYRVQEAGYVPLLIGPDARTYHGKYGLPASAGSPASRIDAHELAGLVVPGGYAPDRLRRHRDVLELVRAADAAGKPIAAICHAGWVLISAGIVAGRRVTGFVSIHDDLRNAGAEVVDEPVVVDGNLITGRGPDDLAAWMATFVAAVGGQSGSS